MPDAGKAVLVTGADGFLGSNAVRALLGRGWRVRALLQPGRATGTLDGLPVEAIRGDLLDPSFAAGAVRGVQAVVQTAASTAVWPGRDPRMRSLNVDAAVGLAAAAKAAGVGRYVHVGTANSFACGPKDRPGDETGPYEAARYGLDYQDTKREAQDTLLAMAGGGFGLVVVNPTFMFGPYDSKPGSGAMILAVAAGAVPGSSPGGRSFADVRAVAEGIASALESGRPGECYILGGENLTYEEVFAKIAYAVGGRPPRLRLPAPAVLAFGALSEAAAALTREAPRVSLSMARISCEGQYYSSAKAASELGYRVRPVEDAVAAARDWFKSKGML
jgi:dihydroflavonol-4-reductase